MRQPTSLQYINIKYMHEVILSMDKHMLLAAECNHLLAFQHLLAGYIQHLSVLNGKKIVTF